MHPKNISILDYTYDLPESRIAAFPLPERDDSKLLICRDGNLQEDQYKNIAAYLPEKCLLVFNNTRVIQARILFQKSTGGIIELFCLEPYGASKEYNTLMAQKERLRWKCLIGGASKWKEGPLSKKIIVQGTEVELQARLIEKLPDAYVTELSWQPAHFSFSEIIEAAGDTPLPPYIKRKATDSDKERYQTIYAKNDGSVAAPTAGLHFTPAIFSSLEAKEIASAYITLHVGAGTFKPVKAVLMQDHPMHAEWIEVSAATIRSLMDKFDDGIIAVGTTSLRALESIYWMGVKAILYPQQLVEERMIGQWDVYEGTLADTGIAVHVALQALLSELEKNNSQKLIIPTRILIAPGYTFRMVKAIITNFHQPQSTLLLLVAAAVGRDWKKIYEYAMKNDFRFLSYGDGSLLYLSKTKPGD